MRNSDDWERERKLCLCMSWSCFDHSNAVLRFHPYINFTLRSYRTAIESICIVICLKVLQEELDGRLERALLSSFDLGLGQVPANSETVRTACKVLPLVQCRGLGASTEDNVCLSLSLDREHLVRFARVDQERNARLLDFLSKRTR